MKKFFLGIFAIIFMASCSDVGGRGIVYEDNDIVVERIVYDGMGSSFLVTRQKGGSSITWPQGKHGMRTNIIILNADTILCKGMILTNDENFLVISKK